MQDIQTMEALFRGKAEVGELNQQQQAFLDKHFDESGKLPVLRHPLLIEVMFVPTLGSVKWAMAISEIREKSVEKALSEQNFASYVFQHERPFRLQAFLEIQYSITSDSVYWGLVDDLWSDSEQPCFFENNRHAWRSIWEDECYYSKPYPPCPTDEVDAFNKLPDTITVYRGGHKDGLSWTLSEEKAKWFGERNYYFNEQETPLWKMDIKKKDIAWFTNSRNEQEVILTETTIKPVLINGEEK